MRATTFSFNKVNLKYLGEVMITQVGGCNTVGVTKDPRRKAQRVQFKDCSNIPYTQNYKYNKEYERQQKNALWTSVLIVLGALLFTTGYFMLSSMKKAKP